MSKTAKIIATFCACFVLLPVSALIAWDARHAYYEPKKREAMQFCERLIPAIEAANRRDERYPPAIDPQWIRDVPIPDLIRVQDFYLSSGDGFLLGFRNPGDFYDDIWGFHGSQNNGSWINYDGY